MSPETDPLSHILICDDSYSMNHRSLFAAWTFLNTASVAAATLSAWTPALAEQQACCTYNRALSLILHKFTALDCINEPEFTGVWVIKRNSDIDVKTVLSKC